MSNESLSVPEFEIKNKVNYWDGTQFKEAAVLGVSLNPISNIIEYKLFYRERGTGRKGRTSLKATPYFIKESVHFKEPEKPEKVKQTGLKGTAL